MISALCWLPRGAANAAEEPADFGPLEEDAGEEIHTGALRRCRRAHCEQHTQAIAQIPFAVHTDSGNDSDGQPSSINENMISEVDKARAVAAAFRSGGEFLASDFACPSEPQQHNCHMLSLPAVLAHI